MAKKFGCYQIDHEGSAQLLNIEEAQIVSKLDNDVKLVKDIDYRSF